MTNLNSEYMTNAAIHLSEECEHHYYQLRHAVLRIGRIIPDRGESQVPLLGMASCQIVDPVEGVPDRAAQPFQGLHEDHIAFVGLVEGLVGLRTVRGRLCFVVLSSAAAAP